MQVSNHCHVLVDRTIDRRPPAAPGEVRAFARCRDERLRLPAFLEHYRGLGVDRFFIVDNDSSDGSAEYLAAQPDVHLYATRNRYSEAGRGVAWVNALLTEFGVGSWCVTVDIDELLVYAGSEHESLHRFTEYLDRVGSEALACILLDLYPSGSLKECHYDAGDNLLATASYFDPGPYDMSPADLCPGVVIRGGMRERVFYPEFRTRGLGARIGDALLEGIAHRAPILRETPWLRARRRRNPPCLTKVPLVRWNETSTRFNMHWISSKIVAPETGALLHFKFLHDFHDRATQEAERGERYDGAAEYQRYADRLRKDPDLTLSNDESVCFVGTRQLVDLGLMKDSQAWAASRVQRP
jgi:glycosyl transferase family 2